MKFAEESGKKSGKKNGALDGNGSVVFNYMECRTKYIGKCKMYPW